MSAARQDPQESKVRMVRDANFFLGSCTLANTLLGAETDTSDPARRLTSLALLGSCIATIALVRRFPRPSFLWSVASLQAIILVTPWFTGGIRRPLSYMEIPFLLYIGFILGSRATWIAAGTFCLNTLGLALAETCGAIRSAPIDQIQHLLLLVECVAFGLYYVAGPLGLTRRFILEAQEDNRRRQEIQDELSRMKDALDSRIAQREQELLRVKNRLAHSTETLTSIYEPTIQRIGVRAKYMQEALKGKGEAFSLPVERILVGCERLTSMHRAISRYSRLDPRELATRWLEPDEIRSMVRTVWDEIRLGYPRANHRLFLGGLQGCSADPDMLRQVWQHLLSNAAKFSARQLKPRIVIGWKDGEFHVNDNGEGFDAANADNLYELFNRQHRGQDYPGNGIGLASSKRIVEIHGGSIRVHSEPGKGTTVFFRMSPSPTPPSAP